jgi:hypothetical protein
MAPTARTAERWIRIDVVAIALGVSRQRAIAIISVEQIRHRGTNPKTYALSDVKRVHEARKDDRT